MKKVKFVFKSGYELEIECESCTIQRNTMRDEIIAYQLNGVKNIAPLFIKQRDVICVTSEEIK